MQVEYTQYESNWSPVETKDTEPLVQFVVDQILYDGVIGRSRKKERLEDQPAIIATALGELFNILADKGIIGVEDLITALGIYNPDKRDPKFVKDPD